MPFSNPPSVAPFWYKPISAAWSRSFTGRRKASVASRSMMPWAQVACCGADSGRHEKMACRLGVSDTPSTRSGPVMARSRRCGSVVNP
jgi:hypothetical protein